MTNKPIIHFFCYVQQKTKLGISVVFWLFWLNTFAQTPVQSHRVSDDTAVAQLIGQYARKYAPDKRTAIFQLESVVQKDLAQVTLSGRTNLVQAKNTLVERLKKDQWEVIDQVKTLPSAEVGDKTWGLVEVSVCNMRYSPKHSGEMATQALMGTPVKILDKEGSWLLIQTPDHYIAWVDRGAITGITPEQYQAWKKQVKIIYTQAYGQAYRQADAMGESVSDMVAGCIMALVEEKESYFVVRLPDTRIAYISKNEAQLYAYWLKNSKITDMSLVKTAKRLMGVPYLWGGTSFKGVDCSGFTKTVYFLNGIILPRDASQQVQIGETVDKTGEWDKLKVGDLLFFGEKREDGSERVVHVGMWIGNQEFIHSSDKVRISSMNPNAPNYDEFNHKRYLRAKHLSENNGWQKLKTDSIYW